MTTAATTVATTPFEFVSDEERPFIEELAAAASREDWPLWREVRLIYADWLLDREDRRHLIVRADWVNEGSTRRKDGTFSRWRVKLPTAINFYDLPRRLQRMADCGVVNSVQLLHFAPTTLRLQGFDTFDFFFAAKFTHMDSRQSFSGFDVGVHRSGLLAFFDPEARKKEF